MQVWDVEARHETQVKMRMNNVEAYQQSKLKKLKRRSTFVRMQAKDVEWQHEHQVNERVNDIEV